MKTHSTRPAEVRRTWHVLDAADVPLGRLATRAATLIRGKHKVNFAPHLDTGDFVVVVNAERVALTGRKSEQKVYHWHSQYPGGLKTRSVREQAERNPIRIVERAVFGMLPHNKLGRSLHGHLKVYAGPEHPHEAQVNGPAQPALSQPPPPERRRAKRPAARRTASPAITPVASTPAGITPAATVATPPEVEALPVAEDTVGPVPAQMPPLVDEEPAVAENEAVETAVEPEETNP